MNGVLCYVLVERNSRVCIFSKVECTGIGVVKVKACENDESYIKIEMNTCKKAHRPVSSMYHEYQSYGVWAGISEFLSGDGLPEGIEG